MKPFIIPSFERLEQVVGIIALRADCLGKRETVAACMDDIDKRWKSGLLTLDQRVGLYSTLLRGTQRDEDEKAMTLSGLA